MRAIVLMLPSAQTEGKAPPVLGCWPVYCKNVMLFTAQTLTFFPTSRKIIMRSDRRNSEGTRQSPLMSGPRAVQVARPPLAGNYQLGPFFTGDWMHYYKRNIGDYHKKAGRLTMLEHGSYMLLMDACYDRERFPTRDEAIEWTWARGDEEVAAVEFVLRKFFTLEGEIYVQQRIADELEAYNQKAGKNKQIAIQREKARKEAQHEPCTKRAPSVHESSPNQEPLTNNHKPVTSVTTEAFDAFYDLYPKKVGKPAALKAWRRLNPSSDLIATIHNDIRKRLELGAWCTGEGKAFIPGPAPYLNQEKWNDEIIPRPEKSNGHAQGNVSQLEHQRRLTPSERTQLARERAYERERLERESG